MRLVKSGADDDGAGDASETEREVPEHFTHRVRLQGLSISVSPNRLDGILNPGGCEAFRIEMPVLLWFRSSPQLQWLECGAIILKADQVHGSASTPSTFSSLGDLHILNSLRRQCLPGRRNPLALSFVSQAGFRHRFLYFAFMTKVLATPGISMRWRLPWRHALNRKEIVSCLCT